MVNKNEKQADWKEFLIRLPALLFTQNNHYASGMYGNPFTIQRMWFLTFLPGIHHNFPAHGDGQFRQGYLNLFPVRIRGDIDKLGTRTFFLPGKHNAHISVIISKMFTPGRSSMETHIRESVYTVADIGTQQPVGFAEMDHVFKEVENIPVLFQQPPVQPGSNVVLAVGIVIAELSITEFITSQEHRDTAAAHEDGEGIADHAFPESQDIGIIRVSFHSAVPAMVVVSSVSIVPAVFFIMFLVIRVEVIKGEPVMTGDKIHGSILPGVDGIDVMGTGKS